MSAQKKQKNKKKRSPITAKNADKYVLYTESVQCPEAEVEFVKKAYQHFNGKAPESVREDFCGTAEICSEWVKVNPEGFAIGVDIDPEPLAWSQQHVTSKLTDSQKLRVKLIQDDVLAYAGVPVDAVLALNFSFCIFKERQQLLGYMKRCRESLSPGGVFVMDIYGGPESQKPQKDADQKKGFTYIWHQAEYNPITNEALNHIHFKFEDGSKLMKAFTYDWRLWTLRELTELMIDAGFTKSEVFWEGSDDDGDGNGEFSPQTKTEVEDAWVAYVVGHAA